MEEKTVSQFLLFRELAEGVGEEMLARGVMKLCASTTEGREPDRETKPKSTGSAVFGGAREGSVKRILLVRDRRSGESWRFGFVEFMDVEVPYPPHPVAHLFTLRSVTDITLTAQDSKAAYEKYLRTERFTIASKPVSVSFIHSGVFVPIYNPKNTGRGLEKYTFLGTNGLRLAYWDEEGYVSELIIAKEPPVVAAPPADVHKIAGTTDHTKPKKRKAAGEAGEKVGGHSAGSGATGGTVVKKALPSHLQFWQDRHLELHGVVVQQEPHDSGTSESDSPAVKKKKKLGGISGPAVGASKLGKVSSGGIAGNATKTVTSAKEKTEGAAATEDTKVNIYLDETRATYLSPPPLEPATFDD